jgi:hypothetical protein
MSDLEPTFITNDPQIGWIDVGSMGGAADYIKSYLAELKLDEEISFTFVRKDLIPEVIVDITEKPEELAGDVPWPEGS